MRAHGSGGGALWCALAVSSYEKHPAIAEKFQAAHCLINRPEQSMSARNSHFEVNGVLLLQVVAGICTSNRVGFVVAIWLGLEVVGP